MFVGVLWTFLSRKVDPSNHGWCKSMVNLFFSTSLRKHGRKRTCGSFGVAKDVLIGMSLYIYILYIYMCRRATRLQKITHIQYSFFPLISIDCPFWMFVSTLKWSHPRSSISTHFFLNRHDFSEIIIVRVYVMISRVTYIYIYVSFCCWHIRWMCWGPKKRLSLDLLWVLRASQVGFLRGMAAGKRCSRWVVNLAFFF